MFRVESGFRKKLRKYHPLFPTSRLKISFTLKGEATVPLVNENFTRDCVGLVETFCRKTKNGLDGIHFHYFLKKNCKVDFPKKYRIDIFLSLVYVKNTHFVCATGFVKRN